MGVTGKSRGIGAAAAESMGSNVARLRKIISSKGDTLKAAGRTVDNERVAVIAQMARGTPGERAQLARIYADMSPEARVALEQKIALAYRNPKVPGLTPEGEDIFRALKGEGAATDSVDSPNLAPRDLPDDPITPSPTNPRKVPEGLDPKEARLKDPSKDTLEGRPPLRGPEYTFDVKEVTLPNGKVEQQIVAIPKLDEQGRPVGGRVGNADYPLIKKGEAYEKALEEGKPLPPKPSPLRDYDALASDKSPQQAYDEAVMAIVRGSMPQGRKGRTATGVYTPPSGRADHLMNIWNLLQIKGRGDSVPAAPNGVFSSPRQMAEFIIRNTSPELLERPAITPSQARAAKDTLFLAGNDLSVDKKGNLRASPKELTPSEASKALSQENPDIPVAKGKRKAYEDQAVERLEREIEARFGKQWGENYKPGAAEIGEGTDAPGITESAVESRMPAERPGTSQDPGRVPGQQGPRNLARDMAQAGVPWSEAKANVDAMSVNRRGAPQEMPTKQRPEYVSDSDKLANSSDVEGMLQRQIDEAMNAPEPEKATEGRGKPAQQPLTHDEILRLRNPSPEDLARRQGLAEGQVFPFMPGLKDRAMAGGDLAQSTAIRREIDSLNNVLENEPKEMADLRAELDAPGLTPARAKEIRDQLKSMDSARNSSVAVAESRLKELQDRLIAAQQVDSLTGVLSSKPEGPLAGRVRKVKGQPEPVSDADNAAPATKIEAEDDSPAITPRPTGLVATSPASAMDDSINFRRNPNAQQAPVDDVIDAEFEVKPNDLSVTGRGDPADDGNLNFRRDPNAEAKAAEAVDNKEAPRDAESARPAEESATIPDSAGSKKTPRDKPAPADEEKAVAPKKGTWLGFGARATAMGVPAIALWNTAANQMSTDANGFQVSRPQYEMDGPGSLFEGSMAGAGLDDGRMMPPDAPMSAEDRIRMLRSVTGGRPVAPQTFFNWRG